MTDTFDGNGDYGNYKDDDNDNYGKRKIGNLGGPHNGDNINHGGGINTGGGGGGGNINHAGTVTGHGDTAVQLNEKANEYIRDCIAEKNRMERKFTIAEKLLDCEIEKVQSTGRIPSREQKYADIYREKPLRISQKVLVPIREHPKFNFVGKLLGPKGNSLRRLQEETLCKMTVLGRNSMRDRVKEEELRASKDPKYAHLNNDLHVEISTIAPPAEAYARIAYAMAELRKYLIPDSNDIIRQEQLRELMDNTGGAGDGDKAAYKKISHGSGAGVGGITSGMAGMGLSGINANAGSGNLTGGSAGIAKNISSAHHGAATAAAGGNSIGIGSYRGSAPQNSFGKTAMAPKQKVMSILEKARTAMDETYGRGYDESLGYEQHSYDAYNYGHTPHIAPANAMGGMTGLGTRAPYDTNDYEADYSRRDYYQHSPNYNAAGVASSVGVSSVAPQAVNQNAGLNLNHNRSHVNSNTNITNNNNLPCEPNNIAANAAVAAVAALSSNANSSYTHFNSTINVQAQQTQNQQPQQTGNPSQLLSNVTAINSSVTTSTVGNHMPESSTAAANLLFVRSQNATTSVQVDKLPYLSMQFL